MRFIDILKVLAQAVVELISKPPKSIAALKHRVIDLKNLTMSGTAMLSRQLGRRAIIVIGVGASIYAGGLYLASKIAPDAPSASHDVILKNRWSSPRPAANIIIVDIDERSLATLAVEHGRWPWPRSVLADGVEKLSDLGTKALLFNVLMSDPDKSNPDSDGAMDVTAAMSRAIAFPLVRLNPANDSKSSLTIASLLEKTGDPVVNGSATVAVVRPMFESMLDRIGVANQQPDGDGAVRRYPLIWKDDRLTMPTIVTRTVVLAGYSTVGLPETITLNWRNKKGRYQRISFSDLIKSPQSDQGLRALKGAIVVLGVSAPGLGQTKGTSVQAVEDDNEILATAVDDAINRSYLRTFPDWAVLLIELATIWAMVWVSLGHVFSSLLTKAFLLFQSSAGIVTMVSASYSNYLVDLSGCMAFGAGIFGVIKLVQSLDAGWSRARPGLRRVAHEHMYGTVVLIAYLDSEVTASEAATLQRFLEQKLDITKVIRVDDLFGGESFIRPACEDFSCQLCLLDSESEIDFLEALSSLDVYPRLNVQEVRQQNSWNPDDMEFRKELTPRLLRLCADVVEKTNNTVPWSTKNK